MDRVFLVQVDGALRGVAPDFGHAVERSFAALQGVGAASARALARKLVSTHAMDRIDAMAYALRRTSTVEVRFFEHDPEVGPSDSTLVAVFDLRTGVYPSFAVTTSLADVALGHDPEAVRSALASAVSAGWPPDDADRLRFIEDGRMVGRHLGRAVADDIFHFDGWDDPDVAKAAPAGFPDSVLAVFDAHLSRIAKT